MNEESEHRLSLRLMDFVSYLYSVMRGVKISRIRRRRSASDCSWNQARDYKTDSFDRNTKRKAFAVRCHTYGATLFIRDDAVFFEELELEKPEYRPEVGSGAHAEQTARILV